MNWSCNVSRIAGKELANFPKKHLAKITAAINDMKDNPFNGDVLRIKSGEFQNLFRKKVDKYRIIFQVDTVNKVISISRILRRSDTTYN